MDKKLNQSGNQSQNQGTQQLTETKQKTKGDNKKLSDVKQQFLDDVKKAKEHLIAGKTDDALEIAFKALMEHKEDLGGEHSILILPALFILAESHIQEGKLKKAEEYLIAAYWNFLKYNKNEDGEEQEEEKKENQQIDEEEFLSYRGTLHKTFSKLYLAQKDFGKALDELKASIYMDSEKYGANHINTALNYYQMGNIFLQKQEIQIGEAFYGKTAEIFYKYFKYYFRALENYDEENPDQEPIQEIDHMVVQEAFEQQNHILGYFTERYQDEEKRIVQKPIIDSQRALALMYKYMEVDGEKNQNYQLFIKEAVYECMMWKGEDHRKTLKLKQIADQFGQYDNNQEYNQGLDQNQGDYGQNQYQDQ